LAGYIPRWYTRPKTVTHPSTNRARRALTPFMRRTPLTTTPRRRFPRSRLGYIIWPLPASLCVKFRPVVTVVAWSVCLSVCLLVTNVNCAIRAEPMEMPFGTWIRGSPQTTNSVETLIPSTERDNFKENSPTRNGVHGISGVWSKHHSVAAMCPFAVSTVATCLFFPTFCSTSMC